jgi:hypothetical protein
MGVGGWAWAGNRCRQSQALPPRRPRHHRRLHPLPACARIAQAQRKISRGCKCAPSPPDIPQNRIPPARTVAAVANAPWEHAAAQCMVAHTRHGRPAGQRQQQKLQPGRRAVMPEGLTRLACARAPRAPQQAYFSYARLASAPRAAGVCRFSLALKRTNGPRTVRI